MKNVGLIAVSLLFLTACTKKSVVKTSSDNSADKNKFMGIWNAVGKGTLNSNAEYPVSISANGTNTVKLSISNLYHFLHSPVSAYIVSDSIIMQNQKVDGYTVFGAGRIGDSPTYGQYGIITMSYEIIDSSSAVVACFGYNNTPTSQWNK
jgi:hypothetical protein